MACAGSHRAVLAEVADGEGSGWKGMRLEGEGKWAGGGLCLCELSSVGCELRCDFWEGDGGKDGCRDRTGLFSWIWGRAQGR